MSSEQFLTLISKTPLAAWFLKRMSAVAELDPECIYVENVRAMLGIPFSLAKVICEAGVREGALKPKYVYTCPNRSNHRVITVSETPLKPDVELECQVCELSGDEPFTFLAGELACEKIYGFC